MNEETKTRFDDWRLNLEYRAAQVTEQRINFAILLGAVVLWWWANR